MSSLVDMKYELVAKAYTRGDAASYYASPEGREMARRIDAHNRKSNHLRQKRDQSRAWGTTATLGGLGVAGGAGVAAGANPIAQELTGTTKRGVSRKAVRGVRAAGIGGAALGAGVMAQGLVDRKKKPAREARYKRHKSKTPKLQREIDDALHLQGKKNRDRRAKQYEAYAQGLRNQE